MRPNASMCTEAHAACAPCPLICTCVHLRRGRVICAEAVAMRSKAASLCAEDATTCSDISTMCEDIATVRHSRVLQRLERRGCDQLRNSRVHVRRSRIDVRQGCVDVRQDRHHVFYRRPFKNQRLQAVIPSHVLCCLRSHGRVGYRSFVTDVKTVHL